MRKPRVLFALGLAFAMFWLSPPVGATGGERRARLRAAVARLQAEVAGLGTQVDFINRSAADLAPSYGGGSICDDPCATDSDGDGIGDCDDYCPCNPDTTDSDGDGVADCADPCPNEFTDACIDPCKRDSDGDGLGDCEDPCPYDPAAAVDADDDGIADCQDPCPADKLNECSDACVLDQDGDNIPDCKDWCPWSGEVGDPATTGVCTPPPVTMN